MTRPVILKAICFLLFMVNVVTIYAQPYGDPKNSTSKSKEAKPYKVLTSGKQITLQSAVLIRSVLVWTANGHRLVEEKNINRNDFTINISINEKIFFVMIELANGNRFTEKIGVR